MDPKVVSEYMRLRAKGWLAVQALRDAKIKVAFKAAEAEGLVRLDSEPDDLNPFDTVDFSDLSERERKAAEKSLQNDIQRWGVWVLVGYWRTLRDAKWESADSCGGFLGNDLDDNGYDVDIMLTTLDALHAAQLRERQEAFGEHGPENAVAAGW